MLRATENCYGPPIPVMSSTWHYVEISGQLCALATLPLQKELSQYSSIMTLAGHQSVWTLISTEKSLVPARK